MAKLTLTDLASLSNQASAVATINSNNALIEQAIDTALARNGDSPNAMEANLDMNSFRILNLPAAIEDQEPVRKHEFDLFINEGVATNLDLSGMGNEIANGLDAAIGTSWRDTTSSTIASIGALQALTTSNVSAGQVLYVKYAIATGTYDYSPFVVLAGTAVSNGYTADNIVVVQNSAATLTFVRQQYLNEKTLDARWWGPALDGTTNSATELAAMLTTAGSLASSSNQVTCQIKNTYAISSVLQVPNYVTIDGCGVGKIKPTSSLALTAALLEEASAPTSNTRNAVGIKVKNITLDGTGRTYAAWLSKPSDGSPITDPQNDYSSPGVLNAGLYPGGITDVIAADRRNPACTTKGYLTYFVGVEDLEITDCVFQNHGSVGVGVIGCLRARIARNLFDTLGTISYLSPAILCTDLGSAWPITAISKANPAVVTLATAPSFSSGATIRVKDILWQSQIPDGSYTAGTVSGSTVQLSGVNSTSFSSTFTYDGYALLTTDTFVAAEDCLIEDNQFVDLKRAAIQAGGKDHSIRRNYIRAAREAGLFLSRMLGGEVEDNVIEDIIITDLVASGIEMNFCTNVRVATNTIRKVDGNGIVAIGHFRGHTIGNRVFRSGNRGAVNYQYGPYSERYAFGSPPAVAGTATSSEERAPYRFQSYAGIPISGRIIGNTAEDNRLTPWNDAALVFARSGGAAVETVNNLEISDNDFTSYPTANVSSLIDYGSSAVDPQTTLVRRNKVHPSQSAFFRVVASYSAGTTGDQTITCNFPPSAVEVTGLQSSGSPPFRVTFGSIHKTHAAQTSSAAQALSIAADSSDASASANTSTFAILKDNAGSTVWSATFVEWLATGLKINIGTSSVGCVLHVCCYP